MKNNNNNNNNENNNNNNNLRMEFWSKSCLRFSPKLGIFISHLKSA